MLLAWENGIPPSMFENQQIRKIRQIMELKTVIQEKNISTAEMNKIMQGMMRNG